MIPQPFRYAGVCLVILLAGTCALAQTSVARDNLALYGEVKIKVIGAAERKGFPQVTLILYPTADLSKPGVIQLARPIGPEAMTSGAVSVNCHT